MNQEKQVSTRRSDLDWLRVCAILAVFVFHSSRFFDMDRWHIKNTATYFGAQVWITFLANWLMPFIFVISGASLFYALGARGVWKFAEDKLRRLLVPLVVGIFSHIMLQVYLERLTHHQFEGTFFEFIPHYFEGWYAFGGNFAWMGLHLWYLLILFIFSLLLYPLFRWLRTRFGQRLLDAFGRFLALPGAMYLLALPIAWLMVSLDPREPSGVRDFGGWPLPVYLLDFLYGFILISQPTLQQRVQQFRGFSLVLAIGSFLALSILWVEQGNPTYGTLRYAFIFGIFGMMSWWWILTFFGFGMKYLTQTRPFLTYANEAVLPFYILHQTVLLCVGYYVTRWDIPDALKFILISSSSFIVIMALYEFLVRRVNILRVLFGMKAKQMTAESRVTSRISMKA